MDEGSTDPAVAIREGMDGLELGVGQNSLCRGRRGIGIAERTQILEQRRHMLPGAAPRTRRASSDMFARQSRLVSHLAYVRPNERPHFRVEWSPSRPGPHVGAHDRTTDTAGGFDELPGVRVRLATP